MSIEEIGAALGTGTNATKHSIFRAVQKLRRSLEPFVERGQMTHLNEEQFVLYYYGEAPDAPAIQQHLAECAGCRGEYQAVQLVLNTVDSAPVPDRSSEYGAEVSGSGSRVAYWPGGAAGPHCGSPTGGR